jgi:cold-inducible RNA-binding protein
VKKIYVGNLSYDTNDSTLRTLFSQHGAVISATVLSDRETGRSRGFGFVEMENDNEAMAAISALNGKSVDGRSINVNEAKPREPRAGGGGGGGGGRPRW